MQVNPTHNAVHSQATPGPLPNLGAANGALSQGAQFGSAGPAIASTFHPVDVIAGPDVLPNADDRSRTIAAPAMTNLPSSVDSKTLEDRIKKANEALKAGGGTLQFSSQHSADGTNVRLVDSADQKVLGEFPPHHFLDMVQRLQHIAGLNVNVRT
jgi:uncharacterized FlaG/YvyC family protein